MTDERKLSAEEESQTIGDLIDWLKERDIGPIEAVPILAKTIILGCATLSLERHGGDTDFKGGLKLARDMLKADPEVMNMFHRAVRISATKLSQ